MPKFKYNAVAVSGKTRTSDTIDASDKKSALAELNRRGLQVYELKEIGSISKKSSQNLNFSFSGLLGKEKKSVSDEEVLLCIQELSTLLNAGIPLADSVLNIARGHETRASGPIFNAAYASLRSGNTLASALHNSGLNLPEYVHELVRAGEETGKLAASLQSAAEQMEADAAFRRETRNALTYPMVLVVSGLLATLVVFVFVVPKFANILTNPKADIPLFSRLVLQSGLWLVENKTLASFIGVISAIGLWSIFSQKNVRMRIWEIASTMPITSRWITHVELARWASMFSVLLQNHVPLLDALHHSLNSLSGKGWRSRAELIARDVKSGQSLAQAMQEHHFVDAVGLNLVRVGEQSGKLAQTTGSLAQMHRTHAQQSMKQFLILLEPVTILLVSVLLGGIMISVMLAITSLTNII